MRTKDSAQITVEQIGKFGVRSGDTWYSFSKFGNGPKAKDFAVGQTYTVEFQTSGKTNYLQAIVGSKPTPLTPVQDEVVRAITDVSTAMKVAGFTPKDKLILAQNACGNVQSSQEWANLAALLPADERNKKFEEVVRNYFALALTLAGE